MADEAETPQTPTVPTPQEMIRALQRETGLRVYTDAPDGIEVQQDGACLYVAKTRKLAIAFMDGWLACAQTGDGDQATTTKPEG